MKKVIILIALGFGLGVFGSSLAKAWVIMPLSGLLLAGVIMIVAFWLIWKLL